MVYDVFISYRRDGGYETAKHINDLLVRDGYSVSFDIDTLREGNFDKALLKRVEECVDFLLIVDKQCFEKTVSGNCKPGQDWLRQEVAYALKLKKNIVTVLLAGASFPENLPDDISEVAKKNGPIYSKGYFDTFYEKLKKDFFHSHPRNSEMKGEVPGDTRSVASLKVKTDFECLFYIDGEERMHLKPDEIQKVLLLPGSEYELKFVRVGDGAVLFTEDFVMPAVDKVYKVNWVDVLYNRVNELEASNELETELEASMAGLLMPPKPQSKKAEQERLEKEHADAERKANSIINGHEYVDLGLPSGTLWATCNIGATKPEEYGDYYAWGETSTKNTYNWTTYKYSKGDEDELTKYCNKSNYGNNGFTDNLTALQTGDDPATANWGNGCQTPSNEQWDELLANTTNEWTTQNGVSGRLFTSKKNSESLFLPAAGYRWDDGLGNVGSYGYYWSSSLHTDYPDNAWSFDFFSGGYGVSGRNRDGGQSVRAVRSTRQN